MGYYVVHSSASITTSYAAAAVEVNAQDKD